ncbi:MAG: tetratricopeptide repeat protein [bacterium]|nr:tetratricopeptide repeat protein [bacterium]
MYKKVLISLVLVFLLSFVTGCERGNIFSWTHKEGESDDVEVLIADAEASMQNGDYEKAKGYYEKVLEKDPTNSEALLGHANTTLKTSEFDFVEFITDAIEKEATGEDPLLPKSIDFNNLNKTVDQMIRDLEKIADGKADGVIQATDPEVNTNLSIAKIINAVMTILDSDGDGNVNEKGEDIIHVNEDFTVTIEEDLLSELGTEGTKKAMDQVKIAMVELVGGDRTREILEVGEEDLKINGVDYNNKKGAIDYADVVIKTKTGKSLLDEISENIDRLTETGGRDSLKGTYQKLESNL